jgi:hypothetical protein
VAVLAAVLLAGCGTGADERQARTAVEALYAAVQSRDGRAACVRLAPATRKQLESQEGEACAEAILGLSLKGSRTAVVEVYIDDAIVRLQRGDTVFLGKTAEGWRVSALGCHGERTDAPADCEITA